MPRDGVVAAKLISGTPRCSSLEARVADAAPALGTPWGRVSPRRACGSLHVQRLWRAEWRAGPGFGEVSGRINKGAVVGGGGASGVGLSRTPKRAVAETVT